MLDLSILIIAFRHKALLRACLQSRDLLIRAKRAGVVTNLGEQPDALQKQGGFGLSLAAYCHLGCRQTTMVGTRSSLVGRNGASKSTLLKIISRVLPRTDGSNILASSG